MEENQPNRFSPKKKWYVYFIDFIMLFVAVTLGFYAENLRDQQSEKNREISYLKNIHEDLLNETSGSYLSKKQLPYQN
jgi:hypothetical protein